MNFCVFLIVISKKKSKFASEYLAVPIRCSAQKLMLKAIKDFELSKNWATTRVRLSERNSLSRLHERYGARMLRRCSSRNSTNWTC